MDGLFNSAYSTKSLSSELVVSTGRFGRAPLGRKVEVTVSNSLRCAFSPAVGTPRQADKIKAVAIITTAEPEKLIFFMTDNSYGPESKRDEGHPVDTRHLGTIRAGTG